MGNRIIPQYYGRKTFKVVKSEFLFSTAFPGQLVDGDILGLLALFSWHSMKKKHAVTQDLKQRLNYVLEETCMAVSERDDLLLQIHSQTDPEWVELTLMRRLGLVPEGQVKVYFEKSTQ